MYFSVSCIIVIFMTTVSAIFANSVPIPSDKSNSISMTSDLVRWIPVSTSDVIAKNPVPAGLEDGVTLFVCRAKLNETLIKPGKLWANDGAVYCGIGNYGNVERPKEFELLEAPPGSTGWVPFTGSIPSNAIDGGFIHNGNILFVCRGRINDSLVPGNMHSAKCDVQRGNAEEHLSTGIEILVFNGYGKALEQQLAHSYA